MSIHVNIMIVNVFINVIYPVILFLLFVKRYEVLMI